MIKELLNKQDIERILSRIAHEIVEHNKGTAGICLVGIQRGGVHLARRLAARIEGIDKVSIPVGSLDISQYRDDKEIRKPRGAAGRTDMPSDLSGLKVVLVDDVIFTGRTIRAAMDAVMDFGRPAQIQLFVLIDRGHRELPIRADYVGKNIPTSLPENIEVQMAEDGMEDSVKIEMKVDCP
jgi:pyrimidine operon attenuation protein/uracil phosphoribosyltransferase